MAEVFDSSPLEPFGVEIDLDLSKPLSIPEQDHLRELFAQDLLIVARNQKLDQDGHRRVMSYLGPIPPDPRDQTGIISTDETVGIQGSIKLVFHSDNAYNEEPDVAVSLHAVDLVNGASSTQLASAVLGYRMVPAELQERIADLSGLNVWVIDQTRRTRLSEIADTDARAVHPLVWFHETTGEPFLYVTEMQTDSIVGLPPEESEALLTELKSYLYDPANVYEHRWNVGDLAVWDNLAVQHARDDLTGSGTRTLLRAVCGTKGFFAQNPHLVVSGGFVDQRHAPEAAAG